MAKQKKQIRQTIHAGRIPVEGYVNPDDSKTLEEIFQHNAAQKRERLAKTEAAFYALPESVRKMTQGEANKAGIHCHGPL